ncbi:hypothetical protein PORY_002415 [Pneumocystis oryctolagi]|uniref:Uncharacterized protein n=1 Tax=Pneumocystis oryctolagi TaxID=42067 RepID=A0ACB7CGQ3_9ASCO|nr:hypothetical protein PORY_002415 [Pneumocystis oryctolagi]
MEKYKGEEVQSQRNNISQSRLFNGYSVVQKNKDLPLFQSFSSPILWPIELGKGSSGVGVTESAPFAASAVSVAQAAMPSPDILFSKQFPAAYTPNHAGGRVERTSVSKPKVQVHHELFLPESYVFRNPPTQQTTLAFSYDQSLETQIPCNNYGYTTRKTMLKAKEKQSSQLLNDSDTSLTGSSQNSNNINISANTSVSSNQENSLKDSSLQEPVTNALKMGSKTEGVIPSAIVVKNIPFQIKKEQLLELFDTLDIPKPYAFNYHFDNGNFRGLAFANFYTPEETTRVILSLNGHDIMGRKLRVEYKRVLPVTDREKISREKKEKRTQYDEQHNSNNFGITKGKGKFKDIDLNDETTLNIYSRLLLFLNDRSPNAPNELIFPPDLHPQQRRIVHLVAEKLDLEHTSCGESDAKYIVINRSKTNNIDSAHKNFWNRSGFDISGQSVNPNLSLSANLAVGMPSVNGFFDNSHVNFKSYSMKSFNDIKNMNNQIPSKTYLHQQMQSHDAVINTSIGLGVSNVQNDLNVMMQDLNLNVNGKQSKNTEWEMKKDLKIWS